VLWKGLIKCLISRSPRTGRFRALNGEPNAGCGRARDHTAVTNLQPRSVSLSSQAKLRLSIQLCPLPDAGFPLITFCYDQGKFAHRITEVTNKLELSTRKSPCSKACLSSRLPSILHHYPHPPPSISFHIESLIQMNSRSGGSLIEMDHAYHQKQKIINQLLQRTSFLLRCATTANSCDIGRVTIEILPEDVLLEIFDHYVAEANEDRKYEEWHILVHVCQKWRYVVFQSPLRLNLRILCSAGTPVKEKLAIWPPLPITIEHVSPSISKCGEDNIIAALGHNDRICTVKSI
jgi:hypothetical protein